MHIYIYNLRIQFILFKKTKIYIKPYPANVENMVSS